MKNIFTVGDSPTLEQVLDNKERRQREIEGKRAAFPEAVIVSFQLNIPGPIKNNDAILEMFQWGMDEIEKALLAMQHEQNLEVLEVSWKNLPTGPEAIWVVLGEAEAVKRELVLLEEKSELGRLFDIDVSQDGVAISRRDLELPLRRCFLCEEEAKGCARSRRHSVEELQEHISEVYQHRKDA